MTVHEELEAVKRDRADLDAAREVLLRRVRELSMENQALRDQIDAMQREVASAVRRTAGQLGQ